MDAPWPLVLAALFGAAVPGALAWVWRRRWQAERTRSEAARAHWQQVFDALDIGLMVFDADDRVFAWNADYHRLYAQIAGELAVGQSFETILRRAVRAGVIAEAEGREEAWIAERIAQHHRPGTSILRRLPGGQWRRITERYLAGGGMVSYSFDITQLIEQGEALQEARLAVEASQARLHDALDQLPVALELYDADDRLLLANRQTHEMFPLIGHMLEGHPTFEQVVRANHAAGGIPGLPCDIDTWVARRLAARQSPEGTEHVFRVDGRSLRVVERRLPDGGLIGMRLDISAEAQERENAEQARRQLQDAIEALPDGFAFFDADDRLVQFNQRYRSMYRESAPAIQPGVRLEDILRYGLDHGQYPQAVGDEAAWLAERLRTHHEPGPPLLQELPGNRWLRIDERRTRDGGVAGVRTDVTALVHREQTLAGVNRELDQANARLAEMLERDPDTGVGSAAALQRRLAEEWARARRHGPPLTLLRIAVGSADAETQALRAREAAHRLTGCARRPGDLVARIGAGDFALLLPHTGAASLETLVGRCLDACRDLPGSGELRIGCAASDTVPDTMTPQALLAQAEAAMLAP